MVEVATSINCPWPTIGGHCVHHEAEVAVTFCVYPGEPRTYDYPGCGPMAEECGIKVKDPQGNWLEFDGSTDLFDDLKLEELHEKAIEQAAEDDNEAKMCAAEDRYERRQEAMREVLD